MTQKDIIESVHKGIESPVPFSEIVHRISSVIIQGGETSVPAVFGRLEPASTTYAHTYPGDISDGPWDI